MVSRDEFQEFIFRPHVVTAILDGYDGEYSLGFSVDAKSGKPEVWLTREGDTKPTFREMSIDGRNFLLVVEGGYRKPRPASMRRAGR